MKLTPTQIESIAAGHGTSITLEQLRVYWSDIPATDELVKKLRRLDPYCTGVTIHGPHITIDRTQCRCEVDRLIHGGPLHNEGCPEITQ